MESFNIGRRELLKTGIISGASLALGSLWPLRVESAGRPGKKFKFLHFTDVHVQPELRAAQGFTRCVEQMNSHKADLAVSGGDLVFDVLKASADRNRLLWDLYEDVLAGLKAPVHQVIGNHDNFALSNPSIASSAPGYGKQTFLKRFNLKRAYRSFDYAGWHFVLLDSINPVKGGWEAKLDDKQMSWLVSDLQQNRSKPSIVFLHVPVVTFVSQVKGGPYANNRSGRVMSDAIQLRELFEVNNVRLVLQGHNHIREQFEYNGVRYITSGAVSGSWWNGPYLGHPEGYALVEVDGGKITWTYHTYGWNAGKAKAFAPEETPALVAV